jgi:hypothetical protein
MVMGERGMADMGEMEMPLPDNTIPMMTGQGPFGRWRWAACSACSRCAATRSRATTATPAGKHPAGTVAHEYTGPMAEPARFSAEGGQSMPRVRKPATPTEVRCKPTSHGEH